jgi:hypothetical protein
LIAYVVEIGEVVITILREHLHFVNHGFSFGHIEAAVIGVAT